MKNILKYGVVPLIVGAFLLCVTVMLLPVLINVQKYLPQIEKQVAQHTGRSFSVGSDFGLTFFPWLSVTFSDMRLGNPEGIVGDDFIQIDSFEARVKLLPLLVNKVEVSRFVVSGLNINLQREKSGASNWEIFHSESLPGKNANDFSHLNWLLSRDIFVELFAVTGGSVFYSDEVTGVEHKVKDLMVLLNDVSPTSKAKTDFKARINSNQIRGTGAIGPVSAGLESLFMDLRLQVKDRLQAIVKGECSYPVSSSTCDLKVSIPRFSLLDLYGKRDGEDGKILNDILGAQSIELEGQFLGSLDKFSVKSGSGLINDTSFTYEWTHDSNREKINTAEIRFNRLSLGRYFSHEPEGSAGNEGELAGLFLDSLKSKPFLAHVRGDEVTLDNIHLKDVDMQLSVEDGVMKANEGTFILNEGRGSFDAMLGLDDKPGSVESNIAFSEIQLEAFSREVLGSPFLKGSLSGRVYLERSAVAGSEGGKAFAGNGSIEINSGSILGINIVKGNSTEAENRTDFEMLSADITLGAGYVRLQPFTHVGADGTTDLSAVVQLSDLSFSVSPEKVGDVEDVLSIAGSYGPDGLVVDGFTDVHETKIHEMRDAQTLVDEKMPAPIEEDVTNINGTPLIDPAVVAQRFGLRAESIKPSKAKKAYNVGRGRVIIHDLKELDSSIFTE